MKRPREPCESLNSTSVHETVETVEAVETARARFRAAVRPAVEDALRCGTFDEQSIRAEFESIMDSCHSSFGVVGQHAERRLVSRRSASTEQRSVTLEDEQSSLSQPSPSSTELEECAICQGDINDKATLDGCPHAFCFGCVMQWCETCQGYGKRATCPQCRESITEITTTANGTVPAPAPEHPIASLSDLSEAEYSRYLSVVTEERRAFRARERAELERANMEAMSGRIVEGEVVRPSPSATSRENRVEQRAQRREEQLHTEQPMARDEAYSEPDSNSETGSTETAESSTISDPIQLLDGADAVRSEVSRAIGQAKEQGFNVGLQKKRPLPAGWAIAKTANANPGSGRDFVILCVLARARCIASGGSAADVITYRKDQAARVLLSPRGRTLFAKVRADTTPEQMNELRKKPKSIRPPTALIADLMEAGLSRSVDSGLALPDPTHVLFDLWWHHHRLSVEAMSPNATSEAIKCARQAANALYDAVRRSRNAC